jgi:transcription initiation factor TFIIB
MKGQACAECGGRIFFGKQETYCTSCGLVVEDEPINLGEESFAGNPEQAAKQRRTGAPITWLNPEIGSIFHPWEGKKRSK